MPKTLYEKHITLFPRLDKNHTEVAYDILQEILTRHPNLKGEMLYVSLQENSRTNVGTLHIRFYDPKKRDAHDWLYFVVRLLTGFVLGWVLVNLILNR